MNTPQSWNLEGKRALICGASQGIGRATAELLSQRGASVALLARSEELLTELAKQIEAQTGKTSPVLAVDLDDRAQLTNQIEELTQTWGPVHILINNSGGPAGGPLIQAEARAFEQAFGRHVLAAQLLTQILVPGMVQESYGRIINIISTSVKEPIPNLGVSNTIRGAVASWAKTLAGELPPPITINNVLPGFTDTPRLAKLKESAAKGRGVSEEAVEQAWMNQVPLKRVANPIEVAEAIAFLAAPAASFIRGVSLPVDGGRIKGL